MRVAEALIVFAAACVLDFAIARYQLAVLRRHAHGAARWSVLVALCSAFCTLAYVDDPAWLVVAAAGYYTGTWLAVKR